MVLMTNNDWDMNAIHSVQIPIVMFGITEQ